MKTNLGFTGFSVEFYKILKEELIRIPSTCSTKQKGKDHYKFISQKSILPQFPNLDSKTTTKNDKTEVYAKSIQQSSLVKLLMNRDRDNSQ